MNCNSTKLLVFSELPNVTTGVYVPRNNSLITGHENGLVIRWHLPKGNYEILNRCSSRIETISLSDENEIAIGSHEGDLIALNLENGKKEVIQEAAYGTHSRVWRTIWPKPNSLVVTSTYGVTNLYLRKGTVWEKLPIVGHSNSIFGLGALDGELVGSGDYLGNILIWKPQADQTLKAVCSLRVMRAVEDIAWHKDGSFGIIEQGGSIRVFEKPDKDIENWQWVLSIDNASSSGRCIHISEDGATIFAGTDNEVVQFETDSQQVGSIDIRGARRIFSKGNMIFVLTVGGFECFERKGIEVKADFIKYRYVKISLIGHTGVGKSTLCNYIVTGSPGNVKSTFGKRVWNWSIPSSDPLEKRVIFHDHGGQETVLGTFLPFLNDSDIILIVFQQNDKRTLTTALETFNQIKNNLNPKTKIFFVQTFIDQDVNDVENDEASIENMVEEEKIDGYVKVSSANGNGVEELKKQILKELSWENTRTMIQSQYSTCALETITRLQEENVSVIPFEQLKEQYSKVSGLTIPARHLKFLLKDLSNQGIIEYYPEVSNLIIVNDEMYNKLRTKVPSFVEARNGIVSFDDLIDTFKHKEYLAILDLVYQNYKISIKNHNLRIFYEKLGIGQIKITEPFRTLLNAPCEERFLSFRKMETSRLIEALSELDLDCIEASQMEALFCWNGNACLYYSFSPIGDAIRGNKLKCTYYIGGTKKQICDRLKSEFESIVEGLYGPFVTESADSNKKKVLIRNPKFDVALSFAGEQRDYVQRVHQILSTAGIKCFYDEFFPAMLWGTDLLERLNEVYHSQSKYCMMFVSKEYVSKYWPTHERKSAMARQIEQMGNYILPVLFDDTEVPEIQIKTIGYLDARKHTPEKVASLFLEKMKNEENS